MLAGFGAVKAEIQVFAVFGSVERGGARGGVSGFLRDPLRRVTGGGARPEPAVEDDPPLLRVSGRALFGNIVERVRD